VAVQGRQGELQHSLVSHHQGQLGSLIKLTLQATLLVQPQEPQET
jgi:hypothetical protein